MIRKIADGLLAAVLAPICAACRQPLDRPSSGPVCAACWAAIRRLEPPLCAACGDPLPTWRPSIRDRGAEAPRGEPGAAPRREAGAASCGDHICGRCRSGPRVLAAARAAAEYDGAMRDILHALKYGGRRSLARPLGALMRAHGGAVLAGADAVVPVPLHWRRAWRRGFNQADELARSLGPPVVRALRRTRHTPSQTDLPADERHANVRRAFRPRVRCGLRGACVVLVDDVSTTGATLEACAVALAEAGVREVRALTAARVVTRRPARRA